MNASSETGDLIDVRDRETQEIVIALVGPVGSGVTKCRLLIKQILEKSFKYDVMDIRVSEIIKECAEHVGDVAPEAEPRDAYIQKLQGIGTRLREQFGEAYLADKSIERIALDRLNQGGYTDDLNLALPRRRSHIIDSLKNPAELARLREVYGDTLWVFGIFAPEPVRRSRLERIGLDTVQIQQIFGIDEEEGVDHGQRVRETIHLADFFVRNDKTNDEPLYKTIQRYLELIFGIGVHTPIQDESGMYEATAAASKSACLSRQVGAAIYSASGELIGVGDNDVPKAGGGLYAEMSGPNDHRCYKWVDRVCHNDEHKKKLYAGIFSVLKESNLLAENVMLDNVAAALKHTSIKNLIEFSRAVHAEMEAIVSVARGHKDGIVGGTLYTTAFPCHNCARHIVASGINRVVYIEPYAKSLALILHEDSISLIDDDPRGKVVFVQFDGVAPKNMIRLFKGAGRKVDGRFHEMDPASAKPIFPTPLDGFATREQIVVRRLKQAEENKSTEGSS